MLGGMILGFLMKAKQRIVSINEKLITYAIYLLLFMMGLSIGSNNQLVESLSSLGVLALVLSVGAVAGSVLTGFVIFKLFFKNNRY